MLLLNLTPLDFETLDRYEEVPRPYTREKIEVIDRYGDAVRCWFICQCFYYGQQGMTRFWFAELSSSAPRTSAIDRFN
jgi:hypothetical protein